mmetsp:Transcript_28705/g.66198  ORF Transcript_28705/g.66198 Transcript_28705/m.66198 type:complete len:258 (-) Transcript_28705:71-844(-)
MWAPYSSARFSVAGSRWTIMLCESRPTSARMSIALVPWVSLAAKCRNCSGDLSVSVVEVDDAATAVTSTVSLSCGSKSVGARTILSPATQSTTVSRVICVAPAAAVAASLAQVTARCAPTRDSSPVTTMDAPGLLMNIFSDSVLIGVCRVPRRLILAVLLKGAASVPISSLPLISMEVQVKLRSRGAKIRSPSITTWPSGGGETSSMTTRPCGIQTLAPSVGRSEPHSCPCSRVGGLFLGSTLLKGLRRWCVVFHHV